MEPRQSGEDVGEGCSGDTSRKRTGTNTPRQSGAGKIVAENLTLQDFLILLRLLRIKLPEDVLNDEAVNKSREPNISKEAGAIVKELKEDKLQIVLRPRLQCRKVKSAWSKKVKDKFENITKMIFFEKHNKNQKTLKQKWETIPHTKRRGFRMKETFTGMRSSGGKKVLITDVTQNQRNEMKCLRFFIRENQLSSVRYRRERPIEFGFLSGRLDFQIKTNISGPGPSQNIILECKSTTQDLKRILRIPPQGHEAALNHEHWYYYQTQAYLYMLQNTLGDSAAARAAIVYRKHDGGDEDEDDKDLEETGLDDDEDEEDQKETNKDDEKDTKYREYKENAGKLKGKFYYSYVNENTANIDELNKYCKEKTLPLYLSVLSEIFEKTEMKKQVQKKIPKNRRESQRKRH